MARESGWAVPLYDVPIHTAAQCMPGTSSIMHLSPEPRQSIEPMEPFQSAFIHHWPCGPSEQVSERARSSHEKHHLAPTIIVGKRGTRGGIAGSVYWRPAASRLSNMCKPPSYKILMYWDVVSHSADYLSEATVICHCSVAQQTKPRMLARNHPSDCARA